MWHHLLFWYIVHWLIFTVSFIDVVNCLFQVYMQREKIIFRTLRIYFERYLTISGLSGRIESIAYILVHWNHCMYVCVCFECLCLWGKASSWLQSIKINGFYGLPGLLFQKYIWKMPGSSVGAVIWILLFNKSDYSRHVFIFWRL